MRAQAIQHAILQPQELAVVSIACRLQTDLRQTLTRGVNLEQRRVLCGLATSINHTT
jgi:hypothetical protein